MRSARLPRRASGVRAGRTPVGGRYVFSRRAAMVRSWRRNATGIGRRTRLRLDVLEDRALMDVGFRAIDGTGNNVNHSAWGGAGTDLIRKAPAAYSDGVSAPAGADRPSAREISNTIVAHPGETSS